MSPIVLIAFTLLSNDVELSRALTQHPATALTLTFENRRETDTFVILDESGGVRPDELARLSHFVRCWHTDKEKPMHPRLLEVVARTAEHFGVTDLQVVSGFRSPPYGAPRSLHFLGQAMDLRIPGVPTKQVAAWVWENFRHVGVGYYSRQDFVHIDVRESDVRWVDGAAPGKRAKARYFGRPVDQMEAPAGAPRLAWDIEQEKLGRRAESLAAIAFH